MAGCKITEMQCMRASLAESGKEILVLSLCAFVLFSIIQAIDRAGAAQPADTLRDQRRERQRAHTDKEPRRDAPRPRGPSSVGHISTKSLAAMPPKLHDPTCGARVYHCTPDRSEDGTSSRRLVGVVASHATVNTVDSSGDCERPKAHRDGKGSRLAPGFSQTTSRDALTADVPLRISSSIRRKDAPRGNEVVMPGRCEPNERWEQHAEEPPILEVGEVIVQLPFSRSAPTLMVSAERPTAERPTAERPAPRRTASFARMIENTREVPKTPGALPMPISLSLRPEARGTKRITLRDYPAKN